MCGGSLSDLTAAIRWAAGIAVPGVPPNAHPAKIINLSLGYYLGAGKTCALNDPSLQSAINDVTTQKGVSVVVAAGNDNVDAKAFSPASCNNTVTVAATARDNTKAWYSNFGPSIDVAAPGGETKDANGVIDKNNDGKPDGVLSTLLNSNGSQFIYAYYQGTSMAAPHVTGVISLMLAKNPALTPAQLLAQLKATANPGGGQPRSGTDQRLQGSPVDPVHTQGREGWPPVGQPSRRPWTEQRPFRCVRIHDDGRSPGGATPGAVRRRP